MRRLTTLLVQGGASILKRYKRNIKLAAQDSFGSLLSEPPSGIQPLTLQ